VALAAAELVTALMAVILVLVVVVQVVLELTQVLQLRHQQITP
jgi:hypothetical protein